MRSRGTTHILLGCVLWLLVAGATLGSIMTVRARAHKPAATVIVEAAGPTGLAPGDGVFLVTDGGLERIGEVGEVSDETRRVLLAIRPAVMPRLTASASAACWRTPLDVEEALTAMFPPHIQRRVGARIVADWEEHQEQLFAAWAPMAGELASAYLLAIGKDIEASFERHGPALWAIGHKHAGFAADAWPAIYARLAPILERDLTPVLGRLMDDAIAEAPKVRIAWSVARGRTAEAYQQMLDWLSEYLATVPERDKQQLQEAVQRTFVEASEDPVLMAELSRLRQGVLEDEDLGAALTDIYREAVVRNPKTAEFFREEVLGSPRVRAQLLAFIETFAPTARRVIALCLFDDTGRTRPELVHFIRSAALNRRVAWVTLETGESEDEPLTAGSVLRARLGGNHE